VPDLRAGWADNLNQGTRLFDKLGQLPPVVALGDYQPTEGAEEVFANLSERIESVIAEFEALLKEDVAAFNKQVAKAGLGAVLA
jgi:hypothetical protein